MKEHTLEESAVAITAEIGIDISYFTDESERNFLHLTPVLAYVLLHWLLEGVADALREELHEDVKGVGEKLTRKLIRAVKRVFGREDSGITEDEARESAESAVQAARAAAAKHSPDEIGVAVAQYEEALVGYLVDEGMPVRDAIRIAQRVRQEAGIQLQVASASA